MINFHVGAANTRLISSHRSTLIVISIALGILANLTFPLNPETNHWMNEAHLRPPTNVKFVREERNFHVLISDYICRQYYDRNAY